MHPATRPGLLARAAPGKMDEGEWGARWALNACFPPCSAPMDTNLLSNIQKLFSERIDVFSPVEFNKVRSAQGPWGRLAEATPHWCRET